MKDAAEKVVADGIAGEKVEAYNERTGTIRITRLIVQGFTGKEGTFHAKQAMNTAPKWSAESRPARAAPRTEGCRSSIPSRKRSSETGANASVIFVPPPFAADAIMEAADAGVCS